MLALTYKEWQSLGWQVQYGQRSNGNKNTAGEAVFNLDQCYDKAATSKMVEEIIKVERTPEVVKPPRKTLAQRRADKEYTSAEDIGKAIAASYTKVPKKYQDSPF